MCDKRRFQAKAFRVSSDLWYQHNVPSSDHKLQQQNHIPWRASAAESLELEIISEPDPTVQFSEAFSVHPPNEPPMLLPEQRAFEFAGGKKLEVLITPSVIKSDESVKTLNPSDRLCYFEGERQLKFFKVYTKYNCEIQWMSNYLLQHCNCVPFHLPRDPDTRVCGSLMSEQICFGAVTWHFQLNLPLIVDVPDDADSMDRICLPLCDSITYSIEIREWKLREGE